MNRMHSKKKDCAEDAQSGSGQTKEQFVHQKTGQKMQDQIRHPEPVCLHPPYFVVHKVGDIEQGPVIARMEHSLVFLINNAIFLRKV
ncbi:MAG: hypothetical protein BWX92_04041 [Deltaproteobacteria bacterium ADurb.Bin135]|nr:MAG: hypothetical protein BWX92_04041 [Deltaproteobacteria bacterium ADurb.Bin135]